MAGKSKVKQLSRYMVNQKISSLSERDYNALESIYNFRCLSFEQIYNLVYRYNEKTGKENTTDYSKRKIKLLMDMGFVTEITIYDKDIPALYQLTTAGINALRKYRNWPDNIYDENKRVQVKGYLIESELNVKERFMAHQYNLNKFVMNLEELYKDKKFKYEDEKHLKSFVGIRPDGVFTLNNIVYFLEMDMGTENEKQLREKWDHYRTFLNSNEYLLRERKIIVMFIVDGITRVNQRISLIKDTINKHFIDCFSSEIEIYVDTPEILINTIKNKIDNFEDDFVDEISSIFMQNGYKIINEESSIQKIFNEKFTLFARKELNGNLYDFILQDFEYCPLSSLYKAVFFNKITNNFRANSNPNLKMILICDDEVEAYRAFKIFELTDILFTTRQRLLALELNEALFSLDNFGNIYCFTDDKFKEIEKFGIVKI